MKKRRPLLFGFMLVVAILAVSVSWLAAPRWEVVVVDERGKPVEGMTVRETWQNYSVEMEGQEGCYQAVRREKALVHSGMKGPPGNWIAPLTRAEPWWSRSASGCRKSRE
jgi:hypothetical protein